MKALIDADILRFEIGYGAETGWKAITGRDEIPPWEYVEQLLHERLTQIVYEAGAASYQLYLTGCRSFRYDIAKTKPYKVHRPDKRPWHFKNLTAYFVGRLDAHVTQNGLEADDAIAMQTVASLGECIVCSRDKDLRSLPGHFYSWELHLQPSFGPCLITPEGSLTLDTEGKVPRLTGTGFSWFAAQCLMGDKIDNIPGLPGWGPVKTYEWLTSKELKEKDIYERLAWAYEDHYLNEYEEYLLEQGRLCWLVRRMKPNGEPELWELGMTS